MHKLVKRVAGRKKPQPLPAVAMQDGSLAKSPEEAAERWRQFSQELHCGKPVSFEELIAKADSTQAAYQHVPRSIAAVPTKAELGRVFAALPPCRAHGSDGISPAIVKKFGNVFLDLFHPVVVKSSLRINEPIQWRGGVLAHFPKPKGKTTQCSDNREIVLADVTAKAFHKCRRQRLKATLESAARETQMGGISKRSTDFGSHYMRTALDYTRSKGITTSTIFVDVVAAFYNVKRSHILPVPSGKPGTDIMTEQGVDPHLAASAAAASTATWFAIQASPTLTEYEKGVLPGDPEADLNFTVLATKVLDEIHDEFRKAGLLPQFPQQSRRPPLVPWMQGH